jgi:hypothetical protein
MAFKMNTSIGKIHAKTQGTKPHAKSVAMAKAPTSATGNIGMPTSPFNVGGEKEDKRGFIKKALDGDQPGLDGSTKQSRSTAAEKKARLEAGKKAYDEDQKKKRTAPKDKDKIINAPENKQKTTTKTTPKTPKTTKTGKKSYKEAYKNADKSKYKDFASFEKAAKAYNAKKNGTSKTPREKEKNASILTPKKATTPGVSIESSEIGGKEIKTQSNETKKVIKERNSNKPAKKTAGSNLREKSKKATTQVEKNRLQNRADRKDGREKRRQARMDRRAGNTTKAEAKAKIKTSRDEQKASKRITQSGGRAIGSRSGTSRENQEQNKKIKATTE